MAETTTEGVVGYVDHLIQKYLGLDKWSYPDDREVRLIYKLEPESTILKV